MQTSQSGISVAPPTSNVVHQQMSGGGSSFQGAPQQQPMNYGVPTLSNASGSLTKASFNAQQQGQPTIDTSNVNNNLGGGIPPYQGGGPSSYMPCPSPASPPPRLSGCHQQQQYLPPTYKSAQQPVCSSLSLTPGEHQINHPPQMYMAPGMNPQIRGASDYPSPVKAGLSPTAFSGMNNPNFPTFSGPTSKLACDEISTGKGKQEVKNDASDLKKAGLKKQGCGRCC